MSNDFYERITSSGVPYVVAELGANHNGDMELAKKMISEAKRAGADCVKFQSWSKESLFSKGLYDRDRVFEKSIERCSISEKQLLAMKEFCHALAIDFASTPFSRRELEFLVDDLGVSFAKVASMDVNNYPFLEYIAGKGIPVVLSTGLSELDEIDRAIRTIEDVGNRQIVILHCVSSYPPRDEEVNLRRMETLRTIYPYPVGFSDHTLGFSIPLAAITMGARMLEKHFTLDKNMEGWDHKVSATPDEMQIICEEGRRINIAKGQGRIMPQEGSQTKEAFRRSVVAARDLAAGDKIKGTDLEFKRPGTGIAPGEVGYVVGRTLVRNVARDDLIQWSDLV